MLPKKSSALGATL
jgi:hypothetical protein